MTVADASLSPQLAVAVQSQLDQAAADGALDRVFKELSGFTRLAARSHRLSMALLHTDIPIDVRRQLVTDLTSGSLHYATVNVIVSVLSDRQASRRPLATSLLSVTAAAAFTDAERGDGLEALERALYGFAETIGKNPALRDALTNPGVGDNAKLELVSDLLNGRVDERAIELIRSMVAIGHGRDADELALGLSAQAAQRRNKVVAYITSAVALDDERKARLVEALERTTGKSIEGRFEVSESVLGSVVVRIGDEVLDGSVRHRLNQAREALLAS